MKITLLLLGISICLIAIYVLVHSILEDKAKREMEFMMRGNDSDYIRQNRRTNI